MENKSLIILSGIVILLGLLGFGAYFYLSYIYEGEGIEFITVRMYDADKNLIGGGTAQSIVNGVRGVSYIDLTVTASNTGTEPLTCNIISVSPPAFDSALTKVEKTVPATSPAKASWTSDLIAVAPFEQPTGSTTFSATLRCSYNDGQTIVDLADKQGSVDIEIRSDSASASFSVNVLSGGTPTEYCGDGVCQADEDSGSCPEDCSVSANVNYRTTDLTYVAGTAVGYTATCGNALTAYGKTSGACTEHNCANSDQAFNAPSQSGTVKVWIRDVDNICICDNGQSSGYPKRYNTGDSDASKVDTSPISFDADKEITC